MTAAEVYGFGNVQPTGFDMPVQENSGNANPTYQVTDNAATGMAVAGVPSGHHSMGHHNPMFWLLVLALVVTGYVGLGFDASVKHIGSTKNKIGG